MSPRKAKLLLVEDDPADAELTLLSLREERLNTEFEIARDGAEALDLIFRQGVYENHPWDQPCLILLDLKLPRVSGHEVLRALKTDDRTRTIPVVVLTSSNQERDIAECYHLGANSFVQKPADLREFREKVRQCGAYWLNVNQPAPEAKF